jgi:acyl carrier protein
MPQHVTLIGAEDVSRAGYSMRDAASTMSSAANSIANSLEMHQRFLDDWLVRFTEALQIASPAGEKIRSAQDEAMEVSPVTAQSAVGEASPSIADRTWKIVVEHLGIDVDKFSDTSSFIEDMRADSLDLVELVMAFEEEFSIEIDDHEAERILTVGDAIRYVEKAVR